jgi:hypothetical protein
MPFIYAVNDTSHNPKEDDIKDDERKNEKKD